MLYKNLPLLFFYTIELTTEWDSPGMPANQRQSGCASCWRSVWLRVPWAGRDWRCPAAHHRWCEPRPSPCLRVEWAWGPSRRSWWEPAGLPLKQIPRHQGCCRDLPVRDPPVRDPPVRDPPVRDPQATVTVIITGFNILPISATCQFICMFQFLRATLLY